MLDGYVINFQLVLVLRMLLASLCGMAVGYERKIHLKSAGEKTHVIVALASALMMEVSKYGFSDIGDADGARIAAQVVSGISFLGAGIIIKRNQNVEGLTTAAGIWMMSGIGLAIGAGMYVMGVLCTVLYILFNFLVRLIDKKLKTFQISYIIDVKSEKTIADIIQPCRHFKLVGYTVNKNNGSNRLEMTVIFKKKEYVEELERLLLGNKEVLFFERMV